MIENNIYVLYIEFESKEKSIFHVCTDKIQGKEMEKKMREHAKKHNLKDDFFLVEYKIAKNE